MWIVEAFCLGNMNLLLNLEDDILIVWSIQAFMWPYPLLKFEIITEISINIDIKRQFMVDIFWERMVYVHQECSGKTLTNTSTN